MNRTLNVDLTRVVAMVATAQPGDELRTERMGNFPAVAVQIILNSRGLGMVSRGTRIFVERLPANVTPIGGTAA